VLRKLTEMALTRRNMLKGLAGGLAAVTLAACGGTAAPTSAPAGATTEPETQEPATQAAKEGEATPAAAGETPITAAAPAATEVPAPTPTPMQAGSQPIKLNWWTAWPDPDSIRRLNTMLTGFEQVHTDIGVNFTPGGPGGGDFNEILLTRIAAGTAPDAAVIWTPPVTFAARGSLDAVDDLMATAQYAKPDKWYPRPLATCQWRGKTYGLPFSQGDYMVFYNVDMFKEKGLPTDRASMPTTWDKMRELSMSFTEWNGSDLKTGGFVPFLTNWVYPVWSANNGSQIFRAADEKYYMNSKENAEWMNYWLTWLDDEYKGDITYLASLGGMDVYDTSQLWNQKRTAMALGGAWAVPYTLLNPKTAGFNWDVAKIPVGPSGTKSYTGFWPNWFVQPAGGKQRKEAFLLNEYMTTVGMQVWYQEVEDTPCWKDFPQEVMPKGLVDNFGQEKALDIHKFILTYLNDATEVWTSPVEDFATDQLNRAVDQILHKATPVQAALDQAQKITQAKLEETVKSG
jgi:multiple sugar transport system substrate-binding protein